MRKLSFGMNTGCLINRYVEPESWVPLVSREFGLDCVQLTTELIRPDLAWSVHQDLVRRILAQGRIHGVQVLEVFTDAFSRVNHLAHPIPAVRAHWLQWMKRAVEIAAELGAESFGSHLAILTAEDCADPARKEEKTNLAIEGWHELARHGRKVGLKFLTWEPMSIRREFGESLSEAAYLQSKLNAGTELPIYLCYDVDHGDISSLDARDTDPYQWMEKFKESIGSIHLKQVGKNKEGHRPFIAEFNQTGRIEAGAFMQAVSHLTQTPRLFLELSFREREPADSLLVQQVRASVDYWRPFLK